MFNQLKKSVFLLSMLGLLVTSACDSGGGSSSGGSSDDSSESSVVNLSGAVTLTNSSSSVGGFSAFSQDVSAYSVSGCSVKAYSIETGAELASTTSDANGNYSLTGSNLAEGENYKIHANCQGNEMASIGKAIKKKLSEVNESDRVKTNPRSTVIAAYIIKALVQAVSEVVSGISDPVLKNTLKSTLLASMDSIVEAVTSNIEDAIESGAMEEPDVSEAGQVAGGVKNHNDLEDGSVIDTAVVNVDVPKSVDEAIVGASNSVSVIGACDSSAYPGSVVRADKIVKCTRAVAKLMNNMLHFPLLILKTGGVFTSNNSLSACNSGEMSTIVEGSTQLIDLFPNSSLESSPNANYCLLKTAIGNFNRNDGYENKGGDDGGPMFAESGDLNNDMSSNTGVLSAIATAMIDNYRYKLSDLDKIVFGRSGTAGMAAKVVNVRRDPTDFRDVFYALNGSNQWDNSVWPSHCGNGNSEICPVYDFTFTLDDGDWSANPQGADASFVSSVLAAQDFSTKDIFRKMYEGPIPNQNQFDQFIDEEKIHTHHNPSGEKEIYVLINSQPGYSSGANVNPCWDHDPTTICKDINGNDVVPTRVSAVFGTKLADGYKPISQISPDSVGDFYFRPIYSHKGFRGALGLIKASDGRVVMDELRKERGLQMILNDSICGNYGLPSAGSNCAQGDIFNVSFDWSTCNDPNQECPSVAAIGSTKIDSSGLTINVQEDFKHQWFQVCTGPNSCVDKPFVGVGDWNQLEPLKFTVSAGAGDDAISLASPGLSSSASEYNLSLYHNCVSNTCTVAGFYLVDNSGQPYVDADATTSQMIDGVSNVGVYAKAILDAVSGDFDTVTSGTQNFSDVALNYNVSNGPIPNLNFDCEKEPLFLDGNNDGKLNCGTVTIQYLGQSWTLSAAINGDKSFSGEWDFENWKNDPQAQANGDNRSSAIAIPRDNAYSFSDPIGTKNLLSLAFNGMLDGKSSLSSTTELNALQGFSLIFMFFTKGDGGYKKIDGLVPNYNDFEIVLPMDFDQSGEMLRLINENIGDGILDFKVQ